MLPVIEVVGARSWIGSKMPAAPWADRKATLYLRWHGTDKKGRADTSMQDENVRQLRIYLGDLPSKGVGRFVGVGSWAENALEMPYGWAKARARMDSFDACEALGLSWAWAQLFTVYGPGDKDENLIPTVIRRLLAGEEVRLDSCRKPWDFLYVDDAAQTLLRLARSELEGVRQVISPNPSMSVRTVVDMIREMVGAPKGAVVHEGEEQLPGIDPYLQDVYVARDATPLRQGLERTIEWIRGH